MQLAPFSILLRALLDQLQTKDQARIFTQPVDVSEVNFTLLRSPQFRLWATVSNAVFMKLFVCFSKFPIVDHTTRSCVTHCHKRLRLLNNPGELHLERLCVDFLIQASDWTCWFDRVKQATVRFNN